MLLIAGIRLSDMTRAAVTERRSALGAAYPYALTGPISSACCSVFVIPAVSHRAPLSHILPFVLSPLLSLRPALAGDRNEKAKKQKLDDRRTQTGRGRKNPLRFG